MSAPWLGLPQVELRRSALPWEPRLLPDVPADALPRTLESPVTLQELHTARALPETERGEAGPAVDTNLLTPEQVRQRVANYEAWLRAQGLTRLNEAEPRH